MLILSYQQLRGQNFAIFCAIFFKVTLQEVTLTSI
jgi:hypothetical protein